MLKPLTTNYKEREITLECTHKKTFPPPQMYGHTPEDIDNLWKQGTIDQNQYQHLKVWKENCGLMVMGPRCLDCKLALKQNPRPGRPHVIETEPWLPAKERVYWEDMKAGKMEQPKEEVVSEETIIPEPVIAEETLPDETLPEPPEETVDSGVLDEPDEGAAPSEESEKPSLLDALENPDKVLEEVAEEPEAAGLGDDILDALAED